MHNDSYFFQNWLYKIASVREVVPRFYLETALLKCYKFSCDRSGFSAILERLTIMIRVNIIYLVIIILYNTELLSRTICSLNVLCSAKRSIKKISIYTFQGFGEPISAAYARLYLVHTAEQGNVYGLFIYTSLYIFLDSICLG